MTAPISDVLEWRRRAYRCSICEQSGHRRDTCPDRTPDQASQAEQRIAEIAELRQARDAIAADIVEHEKVRALVEERLAEAYEHRAKIDIEIRRLRGLP